MTATIDAPTRPHRPCWANPVNPQLARIFTLRRVYADGIVKHRRGGGTRAWDRWAGWREVQAELANTIAYTVAFRPDAAPHPDDVALFKRVVDRAHRVAPER